MLRRAAIGQYPLGADLYPFCAKGAINHSPCGSELARDSGGSVDVDVEWIAVIASKLAPTGSGISDDA